MHIHIAATRHRHYDNFHVVYFTKSEVVSKTKTALCIERSNMSPPLSRLSNISNTQRKPTDTIPFTLQAAHCIKYGRMEIITKLDTILLLLSLQALHVAWGLG